MTDVLIYQINSEKDTKGVEFCSYDRTMKIQEGIFLGIYDVVYVGTVEAKDLEDIYYIFNCAHPEGFKGHSLSVSDIVCVNHSDTIETGYYFVDSIGFKKVM